MAKDDMHVVMYKILKYLYECLKQGKDVEFDLLAPAIYQINEKYWTAIMLELIDRGYVKGFKKKQGDDRIKVVPVEPSITMTGVEFLLDNSMMAKAKNFIMEAKDFIPLP